MNSHPESYVSVWLVDNFSVQQEMSARKNVAVFLLKTLNVWYFSRQMYRSTRLDVLSVTAL